MVNGDEIESFFSFGSAFAWEVDPEFPGNGEWDCPVFAFHRDGTITSQFDSRWGTPLVVRVEPSGASPWVGMFPSGGLGGVRMVTACPSPTRLCLIADGLAYVVDVGDPGLGASIASDQVTQVVAMPDPPLLLFARFSDVVALGVDGVAWRSEHVFVDDISITRASAAAIVCAGENFGGSPTVSLDPATGEQVSGTTMQDLGWPGR